jgi:hypothetical protein
VLVRNGDHALSNDCLRYHRDRIFNQ